jgi:hypothetical protein
MRALKIQMQKLARWVILATLPLVVWEFLELKQRRVVSHHTNKNQLPYHVTVSDNLNNTLLPEEITCVHLFHSNLQVRHCRGLHGNGFFQITSNSSAGHVGAMVRINGPMIDTRIFHQNQEGWISNYSTCSLGSFSAAVYIYLVDSGPESVLLGNSCIFPGFNDPFLFYWNETMLGSECSSTWLWDSNIENPNTEELSLIKVPVRADYVSAYSGLSSTLPEMDLNNLSLYLKENKPICMFGDSQMRNLLNSIGGQIHRNTCFPILQQEFRGDCSVDNFTFDVIHFPEEWGFENSLQECSQVFVNFGQWPASWGSQPVPWGFARYRQGIRAFLKMLVETKTRHQHLKITWVSTNPHPIMQSQMSCPPIDWRFPHVIDMYNLIAREEVAAFGSSLGYFDAYQIALPLMDLSFDMAHYQGPVGVALAHAFARCILGDCT